MDLTMSPDEKHDNAAEEMRYHETNQSHEYKPTPETGRCCQAVEVTQNGNWDKSERQSPFVLPSELENETESGNAQTETEELNINKKLAMLQDVFKTVGGDLEDIKALMLRLREILNNGCDREKPEDLNRQRPCCSGGNSMEVIVIDDNSDEPLRESQRLEREANFEAVPTSERSVDSFDYSRYSTLVADIEILKNKLVALKRNLAE